MPFTYFITGTEVKSSQVKILWVVTPCSLVVQYQSFRGPCCLQLHFTLKIEAAWLLKRWYPTTTLHGITNQISTLNITAMKASELTPATEVYITDRNFNLILSTVWTHWDNTRKSIFWVVRCSTSLISVSSTNLESLTYELYFQ